MLSIRIIAEVILILHVILTVSVAYQLRIQQQIIEDGHRKQIGLWLKEHATSGNDTVLLEPLGYIGYFSQLKMYDFPGLSSPEMVAARQKVRTDLWADLIHELQPDWLVLRPSEVAAVTRIDASVLSQSYALAKIFDVSERVQTYRILPGREYLEYDQTFLVFRRKSPID